MWCTKDRPIACPGGDAAHAPPRTLTPFASIAWRASATPRMMSYELRTLGAHTVEQTLFFTFHRVVILLNGLYCNEHGALIQIARCPAYILSAQFPGGRRAAVLITPASPVRQATDVRCASV